MTAPAFRWTTRLGARRVPPETVGAMITVASLLLHPHTVLSTRAEEVRDFDEDLVRLAEGMHPVMLALNGVGLAGPQVGVPLRIFTFAAEGERGTVVNPVILERRGRYHPEEGCLSVPGRLHTPQRHLYIRARWQEIDGTDREGEFRGLLAEIFEHEVDHLDGVLLHQRPQSSRGT